MPIEITVLTGSSVCGGRFFDVCLTDALLLNGRKEAFISLCVVRLLYLEDT
ncbi:hypothetical protein NYE24_00350 [Paenibacillus sp. FSL H7-0350]|uniref:hypothetical protein n=1 Tax=Paenibacillus sp. FSL H7-0350 TaxID=2975345 RepID=UPI0004B2548E